MTEKKAERLSRGALSTIGALLLATGLGCGLSAGVAGSALAQSPGHDSGARAAAEASPEPARAGKTEPESTPSANVHRSVALLTVLLLQDDKETYQALSQEKLDAFVKSVLVAADNFLNAQTDFDTKQLIVRCSLKPDGSQTFSLTTKPGLSGPLTSGLDQALRAVPVTAVSDPISMEIIFAVADQQTKLGGQARKLIRSGKAEQAVELLSPVATANCKNAFVWQQLGWAYFAKGDFANAEKTLNHAIQLDSRDFDTWANLVSTYHSQGKVKEAADAAKRNLDCAPNEDATDVVNINSALYGGDWSKAETILRRQCQRSGDYGAPYQVILACTLRWQGKNDEAKQLLESALKQQMDDYYSRLAEKELALLKGDWKLAEELGRKDLTKDPNDYESLYDMGIALKGEGKLDEARKAFEAAVQPVTPKSILEAVDVQMRQLPSATSKGP